jgi:SPP1 gp7 family putative phage head morphogenesis protein
MNTVNKDLFDSKVNRAAMLRLHENKLTGEIKIELNNHTYRLEEFVRNSKLTNSVPREFLEKLDGMISKTYGNLRTLQVARLSKLWGDEVGYMTSQLGLKMGGLFDIHRPVAGVDENFILSRPLYKDTTLELGWRNLSIAERKRVEAAIRAGIGRHASIAEIAAAVRREAGVSIPHAVGLARTSVTSVSAQADAAVYEANSKLLRGYQYVAVLDSRTTPLCALRDGKIYPSDDKKHLPPAHWNCRSTTVPVVRSFEDFSGDTALLQIRKKNFERLTDTQKKYYDGEAYIGTTYHDWLKGQPQSIQRMHLGSSNAVEMFASGRLTADKFRDEGRLLSLSELRAATDSGYGAEGDTIKFAAAKQRLAALDLGASSPDDFIRSKELSDNLREYYLLQTRDLEGQMSLTNYRGINLGSKKQTKMRVLNQPPTEQQLRFNPLTGRYEDTRRYSPNPAVLANSLKLVENDASLTSSDKGFITKLAEDLDGKMSSNEIAVAVENTRILFTRYRKNQEPWGNFKAVAQSQVKFDIMNVSDALETATRRDSDVLKRLAQNQFVDPVLGNASLQALHDGLISNIKEVNKWEDGTVHRIAKMLKWHTRKAIPLKVWSRLSSEDIALFNSRLILRLSQADSPDRDQLSVLIGRELYTLANYRGSKNEWFQVGEQILDEVEKDGVIVTKTFGVQKRRMKSKMGMHYFGPYYDTEMRYIELLEPRMLRYAKKRREVDIGMRVGIVNTDRNRFVVRPGFKTYFIKEKVGYYDTRIPVTSTSAYKDFPESVIDEKMADALNWAGQSEYRIDSDFHTFMKGLLYYQDDKGQAKYFNELNTYREYIMERGDAYERFKMMDFLVDGNKKFANTAFLDHRGRIYERGFIGPQSGESFN